MKIKKFKLKSILSSNLPKDLLTEISKLKNEHWKYTLKIQLNWFRNNIKKKDIHNCLFLNNNLVGYTCLRKRKLNFLKKNFHFLLFDTLIIKKKYRKKRLGIKIMRYNNKIILKQNLPSFLLAVDKNVNFYHKNRWKKVSNQFTFIKHLVKKNKILMGFNFKKDMFVNKNIKNKITFQI